jgi:predicted Zn-ribbon and HTH transcriptional regulator
MENLNNIDKASKNTEKELSISDIRKSVCEHVWRGKFINRPRVCIRCGIYENEQQTVF